MKAIRTKIETFPCGKYYFEVETEQTLSREELSALQLGAGYHPCGYDGPFDIVKTEKGYTFCCWNTCD